MIKLPYSKIDLQIAVISAAFKIPDDESEYERIFQEIFQEIEKETGVSDFNNAEINIAIAEKNRISVKVLLNSPNYKILLEEYKNFIWRKIHQKIMEKFGLTEIEAWALIVESLIVFDSRA